MGKRMNCLLYNATPNNNKSAQTNLGRGPRRRESISPHWLEQRAPNWPQNTPSRGPIAKAHYMYLPHPWTRPTWIRSGSAVFPQCTGQTDAWTDRQIVHWKVLSLGCCATRATQHNNTCVHIL